MKKILNATMYGKFPLINETAEYIDTDVRFTKEQYENWIKEMNETPVIVVPEVKNVGQLMIELTSEVLKLKEENEKLKAELKEFKTIWED